MPPTEETKWRQKVRQCRSPCPHLRTFPNSPFLASLVCDHGDGRSDADVATTRCCVSVGHRHSLAGAEQAQAEPERPSLQPKCVCRSAVLAAHSSVLESDRRITLAGDRACTHYWMVCADAKPFVPPGAAPALSSAAPVFNPSAREFVPVSASFELVTVNGEGARWSLETRRTLVVIWLMGAFARAQKTKSVSEVRVGPADGGWRIAARRWLLRRWHQPACVRRSTPST